MVSYEHGGLRYSTVAIVLHWAIALCIIFNLAFGYFMEGFSQPWRNTILSLHISSGITVLALTLLRVLWRITHEPPPMAPRVTVPERHAAHLVHFCLYAAMVFMPITGWSLISAHPPPGSPGAIAAAARPVITPPPPVTKALPPTGRPAAKAPAAAPAAAAHMIWGVFPLPLLRPIQIIGQTPGGLAPQKVLHDELVDSHAIGGYITIALLLLHILGALKHQFVDRERELARMGIGKIRPADGSVGV